MTWYVVGEGAQALVNDYNDTGQPVHTLKVLDITNAEFNSAEKLIPDGAEGMIWVGTDTASSEYKKYQDFVRKQRSSLPLIPCETAYHVDINIADYQANPVADLPLWAVFITGSAVMGTVAVVGIGVAALVGFTIGLPAFVLGAGVLVGSLLMGGLAAGVAVIRGWWSNISPKAPFPVIDESHQTPEHKAFLNYIRHYGESGVKEAEVKDANILAVKENIKDGDIDPAHFIGYLQYRRHQEIREKEGYQEGVLTAAVMGSVASALSKSESIAARDINMVNEFCGEYLEYVRTDPELHVSPLRQLGTPVPDMPEPSAAFYALFNDGVSPQDFHQGIRQSLEVNIIAGAATQAKYPNIGEFKTKVEDDDTLYLKLVQKMTGQDRRMFKEKVNFERLNTLCGEVLQDLDTAPDVR